MLLITVPVFLPLVKQFGYDPVWFGVIVVIVAEVGLIHPPVGLNLFVIQAHAPDIKLTSIYRGIVPFLLAPLLLIVLMFLFPQLALWLPRVLYGGEYSRSKADVYFIISSGGPGPQRFDAVGSFAQTFGFCGLSRCQGWARNSRAPRPSSGRARRTIR